jgi:TetR/AcrR family transcriptional regulator
MDTKLKLLKLATQLFANQGYDAVGVKQIVDAAGVTKPTLYHHFGNKEGLLSEVLAHNLTAFLEQLRADARYDGDLYKTLKQSFMRVISFAHSEPDAYAMFLSMGLMPEQTMSAKQVKPYYQQQLAVFEALFAAASLDHGNMRGKSRLHALNFMGLCGTYAMLAKNEDFKATDDVQHQVIHAFLHGVFS